MITSLETRLFGHRGSSAHLPENTMPAFERALAEGANALELDVHRCADGHFVVIHDADGRRTAATDERVRATTLQRIRAWDAGAGFVGPDGGRPHAGRGMVVPTLDEVLGAFAGLPLSVDLKPDDPDSVPGLIEVITRHGAAARVTLTSFHARVVRAVRSSGYQGPTTLTHAEVARLRLLPAALAGRRPPGQALHLPLRWKGIRLDRPGLIGRCRRLGLRVDYWVVNDLAEARRLLALGATGIMTDDPAALAPVLGNRVE